MSNNPTTIRESFTLCLDHYNLWREREREIRIRMRERKRERETDRQTEKKKKRRRRGRRRRNDNKTRSVSENRRWTAFFIFYFFYCNILKRICLTFWLTSIKSEQYNKKVFHSKRLVAWNTKKKEKKKWFGFSDEEECVFILFSRRKFGIFIGERLRVFLFSLRGQGPNEKTLVPGYFVRE